ncbi:MAG TPA: RDD family protein [Bryobacteraceae bacterium]|jgi:uncharacterized RDD family membrane protein YckC|nr:RDD family protein [Bryobacteraceae bacterium]
MRCKHCGFVNGEDDHRCLRCGRRLSGVVIAAPPGYSGANALAPAAVTNGDTEEFTPVKTSVSTPDQPTLFTTYSPTGKSGQNVIPFDRLYREAVNRAPARPPAAPQTPPPQQQPRVRKAVTPSATQETQGTLDFIAGVPLKGRKLKTDVDAQVFCDQPVATPTHRFVAGAIDAALILIGFGVLVVTFQLLGGQFGTGRMLWIGMGATLVLVAMFYGLIWAIAGRETAGMHFTDLQLITFDGFPLDARSRALRFASAWLSFCSGGLGLLWAVADEENLTWHDHISKTFPTIREAPRTFVKQRR